MSENAIFLNVKTSGLISQTVIAGERTDITRIALGTRDNAYPTKGHVFTSDCFEAKVKVSYRDGLVSFVEIYGFVPEQEEE